MGLTGWLVPTGAVLVWHCTPSGTWHGSVGTGLVCDKQAAL